MSQEIIFDNCKISYRGVNERSEWGVSIIFSNDDIASPCMLFLVCRPLDISKGSVDWKGHVIPRDDRVEDDVGVCKFPVHPV